MDNEFRTTIIAANRNEFCEGFGGTPLEATAKAQEMHHTYHEGETPFEVITERWNGKYWEEVTS